MLGHWLLPGSGRLSSTDVEALGRAAALLPNDFRVGHLQPSRAEQRALSRFEAVTARQWNLQRRAAPRFDALVAGRLPGFASSDQAPFRSALASCRCLLVLDAVSTAPGGDRLLGKAALPGGELRIYRGDFTDPLLRVDDYPTGVRPILDDLTPLHDVLRQIDDADLPFHLGIVPGILQDRMLDFLRSLRRLIVSMHGFEHGYPKLSKLLIEAGDPFNQRGTVGGFDEFAGQSYQQILDKLLQGKKILRDALGVTPLSYIPPTNAANRLTGQALLATGFEYILTEKPLRGCALPCIASDFYARSADFRPEQRPNVASLHATWEADLVRNGDRDSLPRFLAALVEERRRRRLEVGDLSERVLHALGRG